jgi:hypothetical protein
MTDAEPPALTAEIVQALSRLEGHLPLSPALAARIAASATRALTAVAASATLDLFGQDPGSFLAELERLAERD